ncbi:hypothetical protein Bca52824_052450 [Brassica carinata]|uniref:Uncharacterized protein n=1 Tax=Brassica carinata TaxID=52824 RepID=A0A8X7R6B1_BRACI|nr:hypothetical protein Bca52824_052450 [Brassica carinata]
MPRRSGPPAQSLNQLEEKDTNDKHHGQTHKHSISKPYRQLCHRRQQEPGSATKPPQPPLATTKGTQCREVKSEIQKETTDHMPNEKLTLPPAKPQRKQRQY